MTEKQRGRSGRFAPGVSGNPGGRPRDVHGIRELARESGPEAIQTLKDLMKSSDERVRLSASVALLDRGFGKPTQPLDHELHQATRSVQEMSNDELDALVMPKAKAIVRRLVGDKVDSMTETAIVEMALPVFAGIENAEARSSGDE